MKYPIQPRVAPRILKAVVETLEDRRLFSGSTLSNGLLNLVGDAARANTLSVTLEGSRLIANVNGESRAYELGRVRSIRIQGGDLADQIRIASNITLPSVIRAGAGNDTIQGGGGADVIFGDAGDDRIAGGAGRDVLWGGIGNDSIDGQEGDDTLIGDYGTDTLAGGMGADVIRGGRDSDVIRGGEGKDNVTGGADQDTLRGGVDDDTLSGGNSDQIDGGSGNNTVITPSTTTSTPTTPVAPTTPTTPVEDNTNTQADAQSPVAVITAMKTSVMAGTAVHVQALSSTYGTGSATTSRFQWDFGDASGKYNQLEGYNAAHIYDTPGTYNIRLTLTNSAGKSNVKTLSVTVSADTRKTIYVSPTGNDANDGSSTAKAIKSLSRLQSLLGDNTKVLFQRGGTWEVTNTSIGLYYKNMVLGAYGSGNQPVLRGMGVSVIDTSKGNSDGVTIQDVTLDSNAPAVGNIADKNAVIGVWARGKNIAVRNCTFLNTSDGINANSQPQGLLVQDNTAPLATGIRGYFLWFEGSDGVVLGNTVANSTRERPMRMNAYNRVLIAYNDFTDLDRTGVDPSDGSKGSLWAMAGQYVWIDSNKLQGQLQVGPNFGVNPIAGKVGSAEERSNDVVIEDNQLFEPTRLLPGLQRASIRNNVAKVDNAAAFVIEKYNAEYDRLVKNVSFINNTAINGGSRGCFLFLTGQAQGLQVKQNLYQAMNLKVGSGQNGGLVVYQSDLSSFSSIDKNFWSLPSSCQNAQHYVWNGWFNRAGQMNGSEWNALAQVGDDTSGTLNDVHILRVQVNGVMAGASLAA